MMLNKDLSGVEAFHDILQTSLPQLTSNWEPLRDRLIAVRENWIVPSVQKDPNVTIDHRFQVSFC